MSLSDLCQEVISCTDAIHSGWDTITRDGREMVGALCASVKVKMHAEGKFEELWKIEHEQHRQLKALLAESKRELEASKRDLEMLDGGCATLGGELEETKRLLAESERNLQKERTRNQLLEQMLDQPPPLVQEESLDSRLAILEKRAANLEKELVSERAAHKVSRRRITPSYPGWIEDDSE